MMYCRMIALVGNEAPMLGGRYIEGMLFRMNLISIALALAVLGAVSSFSATAAELRAISDPKCDHLLIGDIEKDDANLFKDVQVTRLCLNSDGGSFVGGKSLEDHFMTEGVQTYIRRGDRCHSACALAFLGGSEWGDMRHASRTLEPGGVLGFHAPYLALPPGTHDAEEVNLMATVSMTIAGQIVADQPNLKIAPDFLTGFLLHPSRNTKVVKTTRDAVLGGIEIDTAFKLLKLGDKEARQACETLFKRYSDAFADAVTAIEPSFEIAPSGDFAKAASGTVDVEGSRWIMTATVNSNETPWQTAACAFSEDLDYWGRRGALLWSNDPGSDADIKTSVRRVKLDVPAWYFLPANTPVTRL